MAYVWVALGGALGSVARYGCSLAPRAGSVPRFRGARCSSTSRARSRSACSRRSCRRRPAARSAPMHARSSSSACSAASRRSRRSAWRRSSSRAAVRSARRPQRGALRSRSASPACGSASHRRLAQPLSAAFRRCRSHALASKLRGGEVAEWSNALDSKSSVRVIVPWVRIPPSPPPPLSALPRQPLSRLASDTWG